MARGVALAAAIAVALLAVSGAGGSGAQTPKRGGTVVVGPFGEPPCLNPVACGFPLLHGEGAGAGVRPLAGLHTSRSARLRRERHTAAAVHRDFRDPSRCALERPGSCLRARLRLHARGGRRESKTRGPGRAPLRAIGQPPRGQEREGGLPFTEGRMALPFRPRPSRARPQRSRPLEDLERRNRQSEDRCPDRKRPVPSAELRTRTADDVRTQPQLLGTPHRKSGSDHLAVLHCGAPAHPVRRATRGSPAGQGRPDRDTRHRGHRRAPTDRRSGGTGRSTQRDRLPLPSPRPRRARRAQDKARPPRAGVWDRPRGDRAFGPWRAQCELRTQRQRRPHEEQSLLPSELGALPLSAGARSAAAGACGLQTGSGSHLQLRRSAALAAVLRAGCGRAQSAFPPADAGTPAARSASRSR